MRGVRPTQYAVQLAQQAAFHPHGWPDRPHLSVCMGRQDARTVSHTLVSLSPDQVALRYHPDAPDRPAEAVTLTLPLAVSRAPAAQGS